MWFLGDSEPLLRAGGQFHYPKILSAKQANIINPTIAVAVSQSF
jgi:hypothetical protein